MIANELVGGTLVALGLLLPLGAGLIAATMLVAARTDHRDKAPYESVTLTPLPGPQSRTATTSSPSS